MQRIVLFVSALVLVPASAQAQVVIGNAVAVDGDTIDMTGARIRLFGIDAVESEQTCSRSGEAWACGQDAKALLTRLIAGKTIQCEQRDVDSYGRMVGVCIAGGHDLSELMVNTGYAVALSDFSSAYVATEARAKANKVGIWASEFEMPSAYRAAHPFIERAPPRSAAPERPLRALQAPVRNAPASVYYRNCAAARAAGAAPIYRGQPGYRPQLDGDGDGIACEPYRGRR